MIVIEAEVKGIGKGRRGRVRSFVHPHWERRDVVDCDEEGYGNGCRNYSVNQKLSVRSIRVRVMANPIIQVRWLLCIGRFEGYIYPGNRLRLFFFN